MAKTYPAFPPLDGATSDTNQTGHKRPLIYPCTWPGCDRKLACPHNVEQHIREAHTGEKPYECGRCGKAFARPFALYRHLKNTHGVENAQPGRGRGGGLGRIGVVNRARVGRNRGTRSGRLGRRDGVNGIEARKIAQLAEVDRLPIDMPEEQPQQVQQQQQHPPPPPPPSSPKQKPTFAIDNFTPSPTLCTCGERFDNREALLSHLHLDHNQEPSPSCNCMICIDQFGGPVDGAGVHAFERSAATMRGLMADDLFAPHGSKNAKMTPDVMVERNVVAEGMSDEDFTKNMHMDVESFQQQPAQPRSMFGAERDAIFATNMPQDNGQAFDGTFTRMEQAQDIGFDPVLYEAPNQGDYDDLDAWMGTAEKVFGEGGDESESTWTMSGVRMAEFERLMDRLE